MNMIKGLLHAQITIPAGAEKRAKVFYCDVLGLEEISKPVSLTDREGFWLKAGDRSIFVGVATEPGRRAYLTYEVANIDDMRERLQAYGIQLKECKPIPEYERFECLDPFGNYLEFIMPISAFTYCS